MFGYACNETEVLMPGIEELEVSDEGVITFTQRLRTPGNNVFESSPHLLIEKGRVKGNNNQLLDGSYTDLPDQYTLQIRGETCGLYYAKTDTFVTLSSLDCEPIIKF